MYGICRAKMGSFRQEYRLDESLLGACVDIKVAVVNNRLVR